jgi:phage-related holin
MKTLLTLANHWAYFVTFILVFFQPIQGLFVLVGCIVFFDMVLAVYTCLKLRGWGAFQSGRLFNTVPKLIMYFLVLMVFHAVDQLILKDGSLLGIPEITAKATALFLCFIEVKSIDEKIVRLGKKSIFVQAHDFLKSLMEIKKNINS